MHVMLSGGMCLTDFAGSMPAEMQTGMRCCCHRVAVLLTAAASLGHVQDSESGLPPMPRERKTSSMADSASSVGSTGKDRQTGISRRTSSKRWSLLPNLLGRSNSQDLPSKT